MKNDLRISFLTFYIRSLGERTRQEASGTKHGFDWIIYNIGISQGWIPYRLPFLRNASNETSKTKTEPEFGVDLAFVSSDKKVLRIFVLKDEVLNNKNWTGNDFDVDLRNASAPDLSAPELIDVEAVEIILAYNKDEDAAGIEHFKRRVSAQGNILGNNVKLKFERWNLSTIVDKVQVSLLSPALLPQKYFSQFSYICSQFADFRHGSDEWEQQLIPNWKHFLANVISENSDEKSFRLLPVALLILHEYGSENKSAKTGWIDLMEWGMLVAWNLWDAFENRAIRKVIREMWYHLYLSELEDYYQLHGPHLCVQSSLDRPSHGGYVDTIVAGVVAQWHLARLGILGLGFSELFPGRNNEEKKMRHNVLGNLAELQSEFLKQNPSSMRPILDIHHIQLYLTWDVFWLAGRMDDAYYWMLMLVNRISVRRVGNAQIPFINGHNSLDSVFEFIVTGQEPYEFCGSSSVYLTCLIEMACSLPRERRDMIIEIIYKRLVLGVDDSGKRIGECEPIDLMMWLPSENWHKHVLQKNLADDGECVIVEYRKFHDEELKNGAEIFERIEGFVCECRDKRPFSYPSETPFSVILLAHLKHQTPLAPEFWRHDIFKSHKIG